MTLEKPAIYDTTKVLLNPKATENLYETLKVIEVESDSELAKAFNSYQATMESTQSIGKQAQMALGLLKFFGEKTAEIFKTLGFSMDQFQFAKPLLLLDPKSKQPWSNLVPKIPTPPTPLIKKECTRCKRISLNFIGNYCVYCYRYTVIPKPEILTTSPSPLETKYGTNDFTTYSLKDVEKFYEGFSK